MFSTEVFIRRRRPFIPQHPLLTGKKKSNNSSAGLKNLDDKWSQKSAIFGSASHMTSQISTQLLASRSPSITGSADEN